ncbi:MAG: hypothetical protein H6P95_389, partial [Candidatus Aminicenantes bacterium]|nr:hypothetical protein [Candidatus Aminicenantes bacterium]
MADGPAHGPVGKEGRVMLRKFFVTD